MADLPDKLPDGFVPDDQDARYLVSSRLAWFFPFTEDEVPKLISDIVYFDPIPDRGPQARSRRGAVRDA